MKTRQRSIRRTNLSSMINFRCKYWHFLAAVGDSLTYVELSKINLLPEGKYPSRISQLLGINSTPDVCSAKSLLDVHFLHAYFFILLQAPLFTHL